MQRKSFCDRTHNAIKKVRFQTLQSFCNLGYCHTLVVWSSCEESHAKCKSESVKKICWKQSFKSHRCDRWLCAPTTALLVVNPTLKGKRISKDFQTIYIFPAG